MSCSRCNELHLKFEIRSLLELAKAIRIVQANLKDGTIEQMPLGGIGASTQPFASLSEEGPWEDLLVYAFSCRSCRSRFHLSVDVYHGNLGAWTPDEP
jgi:hypothetical protein